MTAPDPTPDEHLVDCRVCGGDGLVIEPDDRAYPADGSHWTHCPCTCRRPCDLLCRCSGGPL